MVSWVTGRVGITDIEEGRRLAGEYGHVVLSVIPKGDLSAHREFDLRSPPFKASLLDEVADAIHHLESRSWSSVVVCCNMGIERSPLAVAWWLRKHKGYDWDGAYRLIRQVRPEVQDRRGWIRDGS